MIRNYATQAFAEIPFDFIITGHMHVHDNFVVDRDNKKIRSINLVLPAPAGSAIKLVRSKWFGTVRDFSLGLTQVERHLAGDWLRISLMDHKSPEKAVYDLYMVAPVSDQQQTANLGGF